MFVGVGAAVPGAGLLQGGQDEGGQGHAPQGPTSRSTGPAELHKFVLNIA